MSLSRWWTETTAALGDHVPLPLALLLLVLATTLAATGWYTFPAWLPRRLPRLPRRRPARPNPGGTTPAPATPAPKPDIPLATTLTVADRLAAEGRHGEAIRERLRVMLHDLADRDLVRVRPGMTVTEVVAVATARRPPAGPPLAAAATIFSEVWYAQRPATAEHDHRMREHAVRLRHVLADEPAADSPPDAAGTVTP
ncbi:protein of unknown function [Micromonospora phaseoli]|uniref:Protein-glutamine gamma-glutamyltransferase-like C-terminal domain-containing protein n=1 Tax=Micromonospora phaseoli TaxID=1144548 RepID=A0A1H7A073_9ACTN|nr:DUF4129 domain-containing protein [Micromonospora phaseoli]PZV96925.1 uncharacterized protein DUF4129 [Micromonospora phaseoli]GIJ77901.1 hypothetical protein Xph01_23330 [Micromonospora phaseoli]SEJ58868.1 protein of unknown function [Micromonospora phaseoli]